MIKYTCYMESDSWNCYMTELWNDYGALFCKTLLIIPDKEMFVSVFLNSTGNRSYVVSVPEIGISFVFSGSLQQLDILNLHLQHVVDSYMAISLAKTLKIMKTVVDRECEHFDSDQNYACLVDDLLAQNTYPDYMCDELPF